MTETQPMIAGEYASPQPLALGFIGGGLSSAVGRAHFSASRMDGRWRLVSGAFSRTAAVNQATARTWGVPDGRRHDDWRAFLQAESGRLDAVAVLVPTPDHAEVVAAALRLGHRVICEKSLVQDRRELDAVAAELRATAGFLSVTYNYTGYPMVRELRALVRAGRFGRIRQVHLEMPQEGFVRPPDIAGVPSPPQGWRLKDGPIPMVCLDLADHLQHLVHFLLRTEPRQVMADFSNLSGYPGIIDNATFWIDCDHDTKCVIWISKTAIGYRNGLRLRLFGESGSAEWVQGNPEELNIALRDGSRTILDRGGAPLHAGENRYARFKAGHPAGFLEAYANLYTDIADAILSHRAGQPMDDPFVFGLPDAARGIRLFEAAARSNRTRQWQRVSS